MIVSCRTLLPCQTWYNLLWFGSPMNNLSFSPLNPDQHQQSIAAAAAARVASSRPPAAGAVTTRQWPTKRQVSFLSLSHRLPAMAMASPALSCSVFSFFFLSAGKCWKRDEARLNDRAGYLPATHPTCPPALALRQGGSIWPARVDCGPPVGRCTSPPSRSNILSHLANHSSELIISPKKKWLEKINEFINFVSQRKTAISFLFSGNVISFTMIILSFFLCSDPNQTILERARKN